MIDGFKVVGVPTDWMTWALDAAPLLFCTLGDPNGHDGRAIAVLCRGMGSLLGWWANVRYGLPARNITVEGRGATDSQTIVDNGEPIHVKTQRRSSGI